MAISGSSRDKTTNYMLRKVLEAFNDEYQKEIIFLKDKNIQPCRNCKSCHKTFKCAIADDMTEIYEKLIEADVILLGSPTYFDNVSGIMKNFMDRCLPFYFSGELAGRKAGLVSVGGFKELVESDKKGNCLWCKETGGCEKTVERCLNSMEYFCNLLGMKVVGKMAAIHGSPELKDRELLNLGKKLLDTSHD